MQSQSERTKNLVLIALLSAMALAVQWMESLLPTMFPGIPVRIGFSNIFVLFAFLAGKRREAVFIVLLRTCVFCLISGNVSGALYSLAGGLLSYGGMYAVYPLYQKEKISEMGLSMTGSFLFQTGQMLVGLFVVGKAMLYYFSLMGLLSLPAGIVTGLLAKLLYRRLEKRIPI